MKSRVFFRYFFVWAVLLLILPFANSQKISIYFDFNDYQLNQSAIETLEKYLSILQKNNKEVLKVDILGYCDSIGGTAYNQKLSLQRGESVRKYLIDKQYNVNSISTKGIGKENPSYPNNTEENRAKNRRVDVVFTTKNAQPKTQNTITESIKTAQVGDNLRLKNVNFVPGEAALLETSIPAIKELIQIMKDNPTLEIQIEGHICCGDDQYNLETMKDDLLSYERARTVYNILVKNGIEKNRMSYMGYGRTRPLTQERNPTEQQQNRRVEIKIIKQ